MRSTFTNLANMFRVPDLRNKVLFTLLIITIYRVGANIPCPGIDFSAVQSLVASSSKGGALALLNLFSGGALTKFAVFGLGIMPYITSSIIIQLLIVVIPKFEQWREEGAVGQKKLTQVTRYLTIALAVMQSTGLAYLFHNGGGGLLGNGSGLNIDLIPKFTIPRILLIVLTSFPRVLALFRRRTPEQMRYFECTPSQRGLMAVLYFSLMASLYLGMGYVKGLMPPGAF